MKSSTVLLVAVLCFASLVPESRASEIGRLLLVVQSDSGPRVRAQAILALAPKANVPEVSRVLVSMLKDGDPIVRAAAIRSLYDSPPPAAYKPISEVAMDPDELVAKWGSIVLRRLVARAGTVDFSIRGIRSSLDHKPDLSRKIFQERVLEVLLKHERFDVSSKMDFEATAHWPRRPISVGIDLGGDVHVLFHEGDEAQVEASLKAVAPSGFVLWEQKVQARGLPGEPPPGDFEDDEYGVPVEPDDERIVALKNAATALAKALVAGLSAEPAGEGPVPARRGRRSAGSR